jgi:hypothetical protein
LLPVVAELAPSLFGVKNIFRKVVLTEEMVVVVATSSLNQMPSSVILTITPQFINWRPKMESMVLGKNELAPMAKILL